MNLLSPAISTILTHLRAQAALQTVLGTPLRLYDQRPAMSAFPYLVLEAQECRSADTKTLQVQELVLSFALFSRARDSSECRSILALLRDALHDAALGSISRCQEEFSSVYYDRDSQSSAAIARYRVVVSG